MEDLPFHPRMHVFICTNDRSQRLGNTTPSCGPTITLEIVKEVKEWLRSQGLTAQVYCTKASCLGFCNPDGGVMCIWPQGRFVKGIRTVDDVKTLIMEELRKL